MRSRGLAIFGGTLLLVVRAGTAAQELNVEQMIADFGFPTGATERIRRGEVLEADPTESSDRELAVGLTFLVKQPPATVAQAFRKAVDMKEDSQLVDSILLRGAGAPADFESLVLEPDGAAEARRYLGVRAGETLNLSPEEIHAFNALAVADDRPVERVEDQLKQMLLGRYRSYVANGLGGIPPYARSSGLLLLESSVHRSGCGLWSVPQEADRTRRHGKAADGDLRALARRLPAAVNAWRPLCSLKLVNPTGDSSQMEG